MLFCDKPTVGAQFLPQEMGVSGPLGKVPPTRRREDLLGGNDTPPRAAPLLMRAPK